METASLSNSASSLEELLQMSRALFPGQPREYCAIKKYKEAALLAVDPKRLIAANPGLRCAVKRRLNANTRLFNQIRTSFQGPLEPEITTVRAWICLLLVTFHSRSNIVNAEIYRKMLEHDPIHQDARPMDFADYML